MDDVSEYVTCFKERKYENRTAESNKEVVLLFWLAQF
jgi:hypothetical protein